MDLFLFNKVVDKYLVGEATENEQKLIEAYWERFSNEGGRQLSDAEKEIIRLKIQAGVQKGIQEKVVPVYRRLYFKRISAAAAIIIIIAGAIYFTVFKSATLTSATKITEIIPANEGPTLTLSDGRIIKLDSSNNGSLLNENGINIIKRDGEISYSSNSSDGAIVYNTLSTVRGRSYHAKLSDGTMVWLDAMSSIKYPAAFTGKERTVEVTGQAYFDVSKDAHKPFIVKTGQQTIEVLGTEFNINTYSAPVTTLIKGSIRLSVSDQSTILKPKEQSTYDTKFSTIQIINTENIVAWKNNQFRFDGNTIKEIMTEISRWYDIEVEYRSDITEEFVAKISRDVPLSRLLDLLEMTGQVKFNIEGKKITVIKP